MRGIERNEDGFHGQSLAKIFRVSYEFILAEGVLFERRLFHAAFALDDRKEGMAAFVEKRKPKFRHR